MEREQEQVFGCLWTNSEHIKAGVLLNHVHITSLKSGTAYKKINLRVLLNLISRGFQLIIDVCLRAEITQQS